MQGNCLILKFFSSVIRVKHVIGVADGTIALILALKLAFLMGMK